MLYAVINGSIYATEPLVHVEDGGWYCTEEDTLCFFFNYLNHELFSMISICIFPLLSLLCIVCTQQIQQL